MISDHVAGDFNIRNSRSTIDTVTYCLLKLIHSVFKILGVTLYPYLFNMKRYRGKLFQANSILHILSTWLYLHMNHYVESMLNRSSNLIPFLKSSHSSLILVIPTSNDNQWPSTLQTKNILPSDRHSVPFTKVSDPSYLSMVWSYIACWKDT